VVVRMPGAGAEAMHDIIIRRLEPVILAVDEIARVDANAKAGEAKLHGYIAPGVAQNTALAAVQAAVAGVAGLPADAEAPVVSLWSGNRLIMSIAVHGDVPPAALRQAVEQVRSAIAARLPSSAVEVADVERRELLVEIPSLALRAHGLTHEDVAAILGEALRDRSGGQIDTARGRLSVDIGGVLPDLQALRALPLTRPGATARDLEGEAVPLLGQIADLRLAGGDSASLGIFNGQPVTKLTVRGGALKGPDVASRIVRQALDEVRGRLPPGIAVTLAWDGSEALVERMSLIAVNGLVGLGVVLLLLTLFLEIRLAIWVAVGIPTAFFGAFLLLPATGATINLVSLFAFILALGLVVDDAIVAGENIYEYRSRGLAPVEAAVQGARDIAVPLSFSVITNMLAFIPLTMVPGWYGQFWVVIPVVVCLAFLVSWLEALFVLPGHLARVRDRRGPRTMSRPGRALSRIQTATGQGLAWVVTRAYRPAVTVAMRWRYACVAALVGLLVIAAAWPVSGRMGFVLMPDLPADHVSLRVQLPPDANLQTAEALRQRMVAAAERVAVAHGRDRTVTHLESDIDDGQVRVLIHLPSAETRALSAIEYSAAFRAEIGPIAEAASTNFGGGGGGPEGGARVSVRLTHGDDASLEAAAAQLAARLAAFEGVEDIDDGSGSGERRLVFRLSDTGRALGFTEAGIARQIRDAVEGRVAIRLPDASDELTIRVVRPESERTSAFDLETLIVRGQGGIEAPLYAVAEITGTRSEGRIRRVRGARAIEVEGRIGDPLVLSTVVNTLKAEVLPSLLAAYPGLTVRLRGDEEAKRQTIDSFPVSIGLTLALMYGALAIPFRSWTQPLIVLATIPFGAAGAIAGHLIMDKGLSVVSIFGMIALSGVVINAALVMVDYANKATAAGHDSFEAMRLAAERRFRPIMLTTLTTFGGLAPMIFDTSRSAGFLVPIAISMGFGIVFATLAVIILVPCLWMVREDLRWLANPAPRPIST
ncbi:MAG: efflux RND transporter permease subunit, partial [Pseudomonadota bacterium]